MLVTFNNNNNMYLDVEYIGIKLILIHVINLKYHVIYLIIPVILKIIMEMSTIDI